MGTRWIRDPGEDEGEDWAALAGLVAGPWAGLVAGPWAWLLRVAAAAAVTRWLLAAVAPVVLDLSLAR